MTAVIYARYSSDNQREESIEGQIRECTAYAEKNGITIVKHYIDRAISAKTDNRPEFQQMIKDSDKKLFDIVLVWKLDRFARNRYDSARYKTQLKKNGVKLMSATEIISEGPEGIILESVLEGYAEYYSADLSEKVVRGMTENALKGIYNGGTIPFGYMIDETRHYQPDPLLAPYVEQTFQKYADGATMTDLRDWLKAHNIKNSMGGEMSYNTIQRMLSNRRYIGELRLRDVVQPNAIPALVSEDLFNKVQEKLAKNKKAPARHKAEESYLLTTKLYCGKCGALMFGESGVSHTGKMYTYYKCAAAKKKKTCDKKAVRKQWLEDLVVNETMKLVEDDASMNAIIAKVMELQNQESTDLPIYEKQLKETEVGITNMLNAIQMGILTSSTKERLEALEEQRKELQARIAEERLAKPKMKEEFVRFWLLRFRKLDMTQPEQRQALVDTFINAIYLYDDKVLITFNYKEGTETVAFGEAVKAEKSSDMSARGAPWNSAHSKSGRSEPCRRYSPCHGTVLLRCSIVESRTKCNSVPKEPAVLQPIALHAGIHVLDYSANTGSTFHSGHLPLLLRYWVASSCRSPQALAISVIYTLIVLIINYLRAKRKSVSVIRWRSDGKGLSFCDIRNVVSVCVQDVNGSFLLPRRKFAQLFAQFVICHMGCGWNGIPNKHICGYTQHLNDSDKGFQFRDFYSAL